MDEAMNDRHDESSHATERRGAPVQRVIAAGFDRLFTPVLTSTGVHSRLA
jgi:hypothetical protein